MTDPYFRGAYCTCEDETSDKKLGFAVVLIEYYLPPQSRQYTRHAISVTGVNLNKTFLLYK